MMISLMTSVKTPDGMFNTETAHRSLFRNLIGSGNG